MAAFGKFSIKSMQSKELVEAYAKAKGYEVKSDVGRHWLPNVGYDYFRVKLLTSVAPNEPREIECSDGIHVDTPVRFIAISGRGNTIEKAYDDGLFHILEEEHMSSNEELKIWLDLMNKS